MIFADCFHATICSNRGMSQIKEIRRGVTEGMPPIDMIYRRAARYNVSPLSDNNTSSVAILGQVVVHLPGVSIYTFSVDS